MAFQANAFQNDQTGVFIKGFQVPAGTGSPATGGGGYVHTFTRRRWREWELAYEAEMRALMDHEGSRTIAQQAAIQAAADAANKALAAAAEAAETARLNADLVRLANAIDGALSATRVTASIKRAKAAVMAAQAILDELEEEEDMQAILLTLH